MNNIFDKSIEDAKQFATQLHYDPAHDENHFKSVLETAMEICDLIGYKNKKIIEVAVWWHDVGRLFSPVHEELSAQIAKYNLIGYGVAEKEIETVYESIRFHKWNMKPQTIEGNILRDADKLDFISFERWERCIENNKLEHITPIVPLLPKLRSILYFEESKQLFDNKIRDFLGNLSKIKVSSKEASGLITDVLKLDL